MHTATNLLYRDIECRRGRRTGIGTRTRTTAVAVTKRSQLVSNTEKQDCFFKKNDFVDPFLFFYIGFLDFVL
jgi:hypothetical protein